jgi:hypothetical protein
VFVPGETVLAAELRAFAFQVRSGLEIDIVPSGHAQAWPDGHLPQRYVPGSGAQGDGPPGLPDHFVREL